jgi:hypothetical protein
MANPRRPPTFLIYFKARLSNLARPGFWGTAIFLLLIGFITRYYWKHPDLLTRRYNNQPTTQTVNSNLSDEDRAIAADIDNLPVLFREINQDAVAPATTVEKTEAKKDKTLLEELTNKQQEQNNLNQNKLAQNPRKTSSKPKIQNPFVLQAQSLLQTNQIQGNQEDSTNSFNLGGTFTNQPVIIGNSSPNLGIGFNNPNNKNTNTQVLSPLQFALNQSKNPNSPSLKKIGFSENSLQTPDKTLQDSLNQTNSPTSYLLQPISASPTNNLGHLSNTTSTNTTSTFTQPNIPSNNFDVQTPITPGYNSPTYNSQTYNSQTYNSQTYNSSTYNSQTNNSPTYNSQTNNSPIYNSQTYNQPQGYDNLNNYNSVNQIPNTSTITSTPTTSSIPTTSSYIQGSYTSNPTISAPTTNYTTPVTPTYNPNQQYNSLPSVIQYPGIGQ